MWSRSSPTHPDRTLPHCKHLLINSTDQKLNATSASSTRPAGGMELSESGGSLCQVKQLPCHGVSLCHPQAGGHPMHHLPHLAHQPRVNQSACGPPVSIRHRVNGAMAASCSGPECAASRLGVEAAPAQGVSPGRVLVTGGGGYFGFRLGRALASQGMSVILLDMNKPPSAIPEGAVFYQVRETAEILNVCDARNPQYFCFMWFVFTSTCCRF